ncbi:MAG: hypothetical protein WBA67_07680, partial [Jannaschia sp.]
MILAILYALFAGAMIPLGGWLARGTSSKGALPHGLVAFGGGALLSAVALVLVPDGAERLPAAIAVTVFIAGGVAFAALDRAIARLGGTHG